VRRPHDEVSRTEGPIHFGSITPENIRVLMVEDKYYPELDTENPFKHGQIPLSVMTVDAERAGAGAAGRGDPPATR
jgi:hypothetical protein